MVMVVLSPRSRRNPVPFHDRTLRSGFASLFQFSWENTVVPEELVMLMVPLALRVRLPFTTMEVAPWALTSLPCSRTPPQLMRAAVWEVPPATNWLVGVVLVSFVFALGGVGWAGA